MSWPVARYKTFAAAGSHTAGDSNGMQDLTLNATGVHLDGKTNIATSETRDFAVVGAGYGLLATPDRVQNVVVPADGWLSIMYQALWAESVNGAARAAIFIGANQLVIASGGGPTPLVSAAAIGGANVNNFITLASCTDGLGSGAATITSQGADLTTGQVVGAAFSPSGAIGAGAIGNFVGCAWGLCRVFVAAGTYDISVQYKVSSGTVTAKGRHLWVDSAT